MAIGATGGSPIRMVTCGRLKSMCATPPFTEFDTGLCTGLALVQQKELHRFVHSFGIGFGIEQILVCALVWH